MGVSSCVIYDTLLAVVHSAKFDVAQSYYIDGPSPSNWLYNRSLLADVIKHRGERHATDIPTCEPGNTTESLHKSALNGLVYIQTLNASGRSQLIEYDMCSLTYPLAAISRRPYGEHRIRRTELLARAPPSWNCGVFLIKRSVEHALAVHPT
ncbi:hypothetical protein BDY19DRAFT_10514 [Irpex rosettiformis]|uniref:Uncharacterized protein n=1 Tax=Irpex rosettiformis TaxID=378272 RepID=A0ACB8UIN2_9APHY|nr:hypothetical protein BDY19DRAFT_10514 [Irpex rosettiformis]